MDVPEHTRREGMARFLERVRPESKERDYAEDFKEELWNTVVKFGEPVLMGTGLDEQARKELLGKMLKLREMKLNTKDDACKNSSTLK